MMRLAVVFVAVLSACGAAAIDRTPGTKCSATENMYDHRCTADRELTLCVGQSDGGSEWETHSCTNCVKDRDLPMGSNGLRNCE